MGKYYQQDWENGNHHRLDYMDKQFFKLVPKDLKEKVVDFDSFKIGLKKAFSRDASLSSYEENMDERDKELFFMRPEIQNLIRDNLGIKPKYYVERQFVIKPTPAPTEQFYEAKYKEKKTGISRKTIAKETRITIKGKAFPRYRDAKGRFVSRK